MYNNQCKILFFFYIYKIEANDGVRAFENNGIAFRAVPALCKREEMLYESYHVR